jgi:hypothetical protein
MKITELKMLETVESVEVIGGKQNYRRPNTQGWQSPGMGNITIAPKIQVNTVLNLTNAQNFGFVLGSFETLVLNQENNLGNSLSVR